MSGARRTANSRTAADGGAPARLVQRFPKLLTVRPCGFDARPGHTSRQAMLPASTLSNGKTERVEFATLEALCDVLGCAVGDLIEYVPEKKRGHS